MTTQLTPEAKAALRRTIRDLRADVTRAIHDHVDGLYRLGVADAAAAGLDEPSRIRRARLDAWLDEQIRAEVAPAKGVPQWLRDTRERFRWEAELEAAHTLVNRLIVLRQLEAMGLSKPAVLAKGWNSPAMQEFREFFPALCKDDTEGYAALLQVVFDELAQDLPGLYGDVGLTALLPVPAATLRRVVEELDNPELASAWTDDTTLGWVYQYWNDPRREELDRKIADGGKIEPHEIASKTQMFTERYMVEWLLHNSLGQAWLAMCQKNGWTAEVKQPGPDGLSTLDRLEERRKDWRGRRERGEVALDALMPIHGELEDRWKYWVQQPMPDDAPGFAPQSILDFKLLDPACGSGHFLVIAFDLLAALYREEARHRGQAWSDRQIAEWILERNLHGLDIDPRAVQIAAAALYLKAKGLSAVAHPAALQLVASNLRIADLPEDDPAVQELVAEVEREADLPRDVTLRVLKALHGADYLGSLLKVDAAIEAAIAAQESVPLVPVSGRQVGLFGSVEPAQQALRLEQQKGSINKALERFLARHGGGAELGLRLKGEQLAAGVRFVRMVKEGTYDLVVANPPYQGTSKMADAGYVAEHYPKGKADLYAAFLERGLELVRRGGTSAMLTMSGWMFLGQYEDLRRSFLNDFHLQGVAYLGWGAFREMKDNPVSISLHRKSVPARSWALAAVHPTERSRTIEQFDQRLAALLLGVDRFEFDSTAFRVIEGEPVVYWWTGGKIARYACSPKLADVGEVVVGLQTGDNTRFVRFPWEGLAIAPNSAGTKWAPLTKGAEGKQWLEPLACIIEWRNAGLAIHLHPGAVVRNPAWFFHLGVAYTTIGDGFAGRAHRFPSVLMDMGSSAFGPDTGQLLCNFNSGEVRGVLQSFNPTVHFTSGDVRRMPLFPIESADEIYATIERAFTTHESHRETSVEYLNPGPSPWRYAQAWAQTAVDRPAATPLPDYTPEFDAPPATDFVSYALGVALGRFHAEGHGLLDANAISCRIRPPGSTEPAPPSEPSTQPRLAHGILYLSGTGHPDALHDPACAPLLAAWADHGSAIAANTDLNTWLRKRFFADDHRQRYDNRPIYLPLSSRDRTFVAFVSIHRWQPGTLQALLAEHLLPEKRALEGLIADLFDARTSTDRATRVDAERRHEQTQRWREELDDFIAKVQQLAERGPPQPDPQTPAREQDAPFAMDLDDGVMVNAAALWPLLEPQGWRDPKKWYKELAKAEYDWAHLAARYWPKRVEKKCREEPSHAVAHGCFWRFHPARAFAWELRLQDELGADFKLDEANSDGLRTAFQRDQPADALAAVEKEAERRLRNLRKDNKAATLAELALPLGELWQIAPEQVLASEVKLRKKCGPGFKITEPGHESARQAVERQSGGGPRQAGLGI